MPLSLQPPRGTQDRFPDEFAIRKHIFDTWRKVCLSFGYEEYLWPLVEHADIWRAKSGEDVWGSELTLITDREGKISDLALRPEMTPTVTRMVASKYPSLSKPIRRFSIANFYRNERPQRGRNREFRQLNIDMFGETGQLAELESLQLALEIMFAFNVPQDSFVVKINHRHLIEHFLLEVVWLTLEQKTAMIRLMDKWEKLSREAFIATAQEIWANEKQTQQIVDFLSATHIDALLAVLPALASHPSIGEMTLLMQQLTDLGYGAWITFVPSLMRGFDYYDGLVFEVFDKHPDNNRAMFGWGRYNGLAEIFGSKEQIPAIGCAPGDEPMRLFLESWGLLPAIQATTQETIYVQILDQEVLLEATRVAMRLRKEGKRVELSTQVKNPQKAFAYAEKKGYAYVVLVGKPDIEAKRVCIKNMRTNTEESIAL
jgi:histidyl-tRNA synthetase